MKLGIITILLGLLLAGSIACNLYQHQVLTQAVDYAHGLEGDIQVMQKSVDNLERYYGR